jgi:hypothetical protein
VKRALLVVLLGACLGAGTPPAAARTCAVDVVPAATLLLPYFEVDLTDASGRTTLFSVSNASDRGILAHVVLWTDLGVPTLAFDVYLTGYDVQTINLRDVFAGQLPRTASDGQDPQDTISPQGEFSQDINYANCTGLMPPPPLQANFVDHLRRAHRGLASPLLNGSCAGVPHADQVARGYVTVDVVKQCTTLTPADGGYFGPEGVAANDNLLWGDFFLIDPAGNLAQGENLVRLESDPARFAGKPTFYERYVNGTGADGREPLPPVWYPIRLEDGRTFVFDEQENADSPVCLFGNCLAPFPAESGRVAVDGPALPSPFDFGWWYFDMKTDPGRGFVYSQAWMGTLHDAQGLFSVGYEAEPFDSGCAPLTSNPGSN